MKPSATSNESTIAPSVTWDDIRLLVDSVRDYAIFMLDTQGRVATWNRGGQAIKGYEAGEIIGQHFSKFYLPEDVEAGRPQRILATAREHGRAEDEGWRLRKDGTRFWANVVVTALRDENGNLRGYAKVTRDLTERRAAEERTRQAEERFHLLVDAVTDYAIFILDPTGHIATWNEGARRTKGYAASEIIGKHFSIFYTPDDRASGKPQRILDTVRRVGRYEEEAWRVKKDGSLFWGNVILTALRDHSGELVGFAKVTRDLTERRKVDEALRRSEERFRLLVEGVSDYAIYMLDPNGRVSTWNTGAQRMKGYAADEIIGEEFTRFFSEEDIRKGVPTRELEVARIEGRFESDGWRVRKDGTRFWANVIVTPLRDARGELLGFAKITRDLTARREAEEIERTLLREQAARTVAEKSEAALRASKEEATQAAKRAAEAAHRAEEASRMKDDFLATVSHELRTPLNAILGWSSLLRAGGTPASVVKGIDVIYRNAQAQARLIEDILDVSRIITGNLRLDLKPANLMSIIADAIEVVRPSSLAKNISIDVVGSSAQSTPLCDSERIRQVVWNLLSNAVKFTEAGGHVTISVERDPSNVMFSVRDTGRGIDPEFLPYVFDRFKQADSSTTRRFGGLGLGLAIVRHIVELHGGHVRAESEGSGRGASFVVTLPIRAHAPPGDVEGQRETVAMPSAAPPRQAVLAGVRVLVVDDDADTRELLEEILTRAGASVETAPSASAGYEAVSQFRPHILVSDISMPEEDGYAFIQRLRKLEATLRVVIPSIALTAHTRAEDHAKAIAAGFTTHIGKPVNADDLVAACANLAPFATS